MRKELRRKISQIVKGWHPDGWDCKMADWSTYLSFRDKFSHVQGSYEDNKAAFSKYAVTGSKMRALRCIDGTIRQCNDLLELLEQLRNQMLASKRKLNEREPVDVVMFEEKCDQCVEELMRAKDEFGVEISIDGSLLIVRLPYAEFHCEESDLDVKIGRLKAFIYFDTVDSGAIASKCVTFNADPDFAPNRDGFFHPHVSHNGEPCFGQHNLEVSSSLHGRNLYDLIRMLNMLFVDDHNPDSPLCKLEQWRPLPNCSCCGNRMRHGDNYYCENCEHDVCTSCTVNDRNETYMCKSCSFSCDSCHSIVSVDVRNSCANCDGVMCESCSYLCNHEGCEGVVCEDHMSVCNECESTVCDVHYVCCHRCDNPVCHGCIKTRMEPVLSMVLYSAIVERSYCPSCFPEEESEAQDGVEDVDQGSSPEVQPNSVGADAVSEGRRTDRSWDDGDRARAIAAAVDRLIMDAPPEGDGG